MMDSTNKVLTIYKIYSGHPSRVRIEPAMKERSWMEATQERYAYRCLPLNIANQHGWAIYPIAEISAVWHGGAALDDVEVLNTGQGLAGSHFGSGILTIHLDNIFKVPPGYSLYISGAPNYPKKNIIPLTGIYEADWAPYSFTMNWKFTEMNKVVTFTPDEPFCFVFPVERNLIESFTTEYKDLKEDEELSRHYDEWSKMRSEFIADKDRGLASWQKHYFRGQYPSGSKCPISDHKTKLNLNK